MKIQHSQCRMMSLTPSTSLARFAYKFPAFTCCCCKWIRVVFAIRRFCVNMVRSFVCSNQFRSFRLYFSFSRHHMWMYWRKSPESYAFGRPLHRIYRFHLRTIIIIKISIICVVVYIDISCAYCTNWFGIVSPRSAAAFPYRFYWFHCECLQIQC